METTESTEWEFFHIHFEDLYLIKKKVVVFFFAHDAQNIYKQYVRLQAI